MDNELTTTMEIRNRIEQLEEQDVFGLMFYTGNPDTAVEGYVGLFAMDKVARKLYVCYGGTSWGLL